MTLAQKYSSWLEAAEFSDIHTKFSVLVLWCTICAYGENKDVTTYKIFATRTLKAQSIRVLAATLASLQIIDKKGSMEVLCVVNLK